MISIVIPVYNAVHFLRQCLDSLINQTYQDWEAIIIDDGSKDDSPIILNEYADKDARFKVTYKENEGVSVTRNIALNQCKGKYVFFLDADDYLLEENAFQKMISIQEQNRTDFVRIEYVGVDENGSFLFSNRNRLLRKKYYNIPVKPNVYCSKIAYNEYYLCMNLFRNDIIQQHKIRFAEGCRFREDWAFILSYLSHCDSVLYSPLEIYAYRKQESAASNKSMVFYAKDLSLVFDQLYSILNECHDKAMQDIIAVAMCDLVIDLFGTENFEERYTICKGLHTHSVAYNLFDTFNRHKFVVDIYNKFLRFYRYIKSIIF